MDGLNRVTSLEASSLIRSGLWMCEPQTGSKLPRTWSILSATIPMCSSWRYSLYYLHPSCKIGEQHWSSPFNISNPVRRTESSCKTLYNSSSLWRMSMLLMSVLIQLRRLGQRHRPLLMSVQHLLMWSYSSLIDLSQSHACVTIVT